MKYAESAAESMAGRMMEEVATTMGREFANRLSDAYTKTITEYEYAAVAQHGRQILAAIEGTTWSSPGNASLADEDDSVLVQNLDRGRTDVGETEMLSANLRAAS
jgi:hypothetical protein